MGDTEFIQEAHRQMDEHDRMFSWFPTIRRPEFWFPTIRRPTLWFPTILRSRSQPYPVQPPPFTIVGPSFQQWGGSGSSYQQYGGPGSSFQQVGGQTLAQPRRRSSSRHNTTDEEEDEVEQQEEEEEGEDEEDDDEDVVPDSQPRPRQGKRTSAVWQFFEEVKERTRDGREKVWAICPLCKKRFEGKSAYGTSNLTKHQKACTARHLREDQEARGRGG